MCRNCTGLNNLLDNFLPLYLLTSHPDVNKSLLIAYKVLELLEKMQRDLRAAEQVRRRQKEISKNPPFGRKQAFSYLLTACDEHENTVREFWETLQLLQERIDAKLNKVSSASTIFMNASTFITGI